MILAKELAAASLLLLSFGTGASAQDAAPFGLQWLASKSEVQALGVSLSPVKETDYGTSFSATGLPKALSDMETAILSFGYNDQLWRIVAFGREFKNDQYGSAAKARYAEIAASLAKSYKVIDRNERPPADDFYAKPENFSYALSQNEAYWYSLYASPVADIELSLDAAALQNTYWRLIYSHRGGEQEFRTAKGAAEAEAL